MSGALRVMIVMQAYAWVCCSALTACTLCIADFWECMRLLILIVLSSVCHVSSAVPSLWPADCDYNAPNKTLKPLDAIYMTCHMRTSISRKAFSVNETRSILIVLSPVDMVILGKNCL